jgi:translation elongation factor EF-1beta
LAFLRVAEQVAFGVRSLIINVAVNDLDDLLGTAHPAIKRAPE